MRKKRRIILAVLLGFLLLLFSLFLLLRGVLFKKDKDMSAMIKIPYGPVEVFTLPYERLVSYVDGYFLVNQGNQSILLDEENRKELQTFPLLARYLEVFYDTYFVLRDATTGYLYNTEGEEILKSSNPIKVIQDMATKEFYFYNQETLYNTSLEEVYKTKDIEVNLINRELYTNHKIYSLDAHKQIGAYKDSFMSGNVFVVELDQGIKVYFPSENKWENFTKYEIQFGRIFFSRDDEVVSVSNEGVIYRDEEATYIEVESGYFIDTSTCEVGGILKNVKEEALYKGCALYFDTTYLDKGLYSAGNNEEIAVYFLDGRVLRNAAIEGDYLLTYDEKNEENIVYNMDLEIVNVPLCAGYYSLKNLDSQHYVCSTDLRDIILDNTLQQALYYYDHIEILDYGVAIVEKEGQFGFFANEELFMDLQPYYKGEFFTNIDNSTSYMVFSQLFQSVVIKNTTTESLLKKEDLVYKEEILNYVKSTDEMIQKYDLESIRESIYKHEDFFKKFAYIVDTNEKLGEHKKQVMDSFLVLSDFYSFLNEEQFLYQLKQLSMVKVDDLNVSGVAGIYQDSHKAITFIDDSPRVLYHEIMHFIDYNLELDKNASFSYYLCANRKLLDYQLYQALGKEEQNSCQIYYGVSNVNFLTEAGAEVFMAMYFHHNATVVYYNPVVVYETLAYLMGVEKMQNIYLAKDSTRALYQELLLQKEMDYEDFAKAIQNFNAIVDSYSEEKIVSVADSLVSIYPLYKEGNWYEDKEFLLLISMLVRFPSNDLSSPNATFYKNYAISISAFNRELIKQKDELGKYNIRNESSRLMVTQEGLLYVVDVWDANEEGSLVFSLDSETGKIIDYQYYAC